MWTSSLLKKNAWENLKGYYWLAFGVSFLAGILGADGGGGGFSGFSGSRGYSGSSGSDYSGSSGGDSDVSAGLVIAIILIVLAAALIGTAIGLAYSCFLASPVKCGECKFYVTARNGEASFNHLFDNFKNGNYMPTVKTMFHYNLEIFLWTLLFWIPGIIKAYEYALVPYIVAENPNIDNKRVREISKQTMDGEKWNYFVLHLSFIGWYLLALIPCGLGLLFLKPYVLATEAEFYMCMRAKMLSFGFTTEEELTGGMMNGMSSSDFNGGSYNEPNFERNAYNVNDPYRSSSNYTNSAGYGGQTGYVNPNDQYNGQMPGIDDPDPNRSNFNDPNNPYNQ